MNPLTEQEIYALCNWLQEQRQFVFLDTARVDRENYRSLLFVRPEKWLTCTDPSAAARFLEQADVLRSRGFYLAGWFSYEFGYLLEPTLRRMCRPKEGPYAVLGIFREPLVLDHRQQDAADAAPWREIPADEPPPPAAVDNLRTSIGKEEYLAAIRRIKEYIRAGDTYQVNYTMKLLFSCRHGSAPALYAGLRRNQAVSFGAWIRRDGRDIMSFSPELFFRADGGRILVRPMKGTMARGRTLAGDRLQRRLLREDEKNRSENVMIVDLLRNDLGRLLQDTGGGEVRPLSLFDVEVYDTILQMTSTVAGIPARRHLPSIGSIIRALFPCGSVTGAPKIRTMEIIRELEREPRGVYCGAVGFCGPHEAVFNVPIRTIELAGGEGEMGIGSGIVDDSEPEEEWAESLLKGHFLTSPRPEFQLIETLLWQPDSGYWLLEEHLRRLRESAEYFLFSHDQHHVRQSLAGAAASFSSPMRVRLLLHRHGRVDIRSSSLEGLPRLPSSPPLVRQPLPRVCFSSRTTDRADAYLYHKTTRRVLYDEERRKAVNRGYHEVLFKNSRGEVTEGSITNVFIKRNDTLLTPPVDCGLLDGTFRRHLVDRNMAVEKVLSGDDLRTAESVYVGNSVRGLVQVEVVTD